MTAEDELTPKEIDYILEEFDKLPVDLQREIVASFVLRCNLAEAENARLRGVLA